MAEASGLLSKKKTIAVSNTAEKLQTASVVITGLSVKNGEENAPGTVVRVGGFDVDGSSYPLAALGESIEFDVIDVSRVYVYGPAGAVVYYFGLTP